MPNKNTPPKHKTPNYRQRPSHYFNGKIVALVWTAIPLRSNRKDLHP